MFGFRYSLVGNSLSTTSIPSFLLLVDGASFLLLTDGTSKLKI